MEMLNKATTSIPKDKLGRTLRDLRISLTDQCNLRCGYCMPSDVFGPDHAFLPEEEILTFEEIRKVVVAFVACGGRKVRLTGGEPLLRPNLPVLVRDLATVDGVEEVTLTTNGLLLPRYAADLKRAGWRRFNVKSIFIRTL